MQSRPFRMVISKLLPSFFMLITLEKSMRIEKCLLSFLIIQWWCFSMLCAQESGSSIPKVLPISAVKMEEKSHSYLTLGVTTLQFYGELTTLHGPGRGILFGYHYRFSTRPIFSLGCELESFYSNQGSFTNQHIMLTPQSRVMLPITTKWQIGSILGIELEYWRSSYKGIANEILHDDVLMNGQGGAVIQYWFNPHVLAEISVRMHLQEFSADSPYLSQELQIGWAL